MQKMHKWLFLILKPVICNYINMRKLIVFSTPALLILAGILVVKYREDMVTWMTIGLGAIFFMAGVISCISYYIQRKHVQKLRDKIADGISLVDANGNVIEQSMPTFPIVGIGSLFLGIVLASMPETFLNGLAYIFAIIVLLVSVYLIADLVMVNRYGRVGWGYWVMPIVMLLVAIVMLVHPDSIASSSSPNYFETRLHFFGWAMMISGLVMIVNMIKTYSVRRAALKRAAEQAKAAEAAVMVEEETETGLIVRE